MLQMKQVRHLEDVDGNYALRMLPATLTFMGLMGMKSRTLVDVAAIIHMIFILTLDSDGYIDKLEPGQVGSGKCVTCVESCPQFSGLLRPQIRGHDSETPATPFQRFRHLVGSLQLFVMFALVVENLQAFPA